MTPSEFQRYLAIKADIWENQFSSEDLAPQFIPYFLTQIRVKVKVDGKLVTGFVRVTTGWKPAFILLRYRNSESSSIILKDSTPIVAVKHPGDTQYRPIPT